MKSAIVFGEHDIQFVEEVRPIPGDNDVVTKVAFCGLCGTDKSIYNGNSPFLNTGLIKYPIRLGHEWSGIVDSVGKNVKSFKPGDRVCGDNVVTCGICSQCKAGDYAFCKNLRAVGSVYTWPGAFAEYMIMPERHMFHLPDEVSLLEGAMVEPAATGLYASVQANIQPGSTVVVHGTGVIGITAAQSAKHLGAAVVIVVGRSPAKLEICKNLGVDIVLNAHEVDVTQTILNLTGGKGAASIIESTGSASVLCSCIQQTSPQGTISVVGSYGSTVDGFDANNVVFKNLHITGLNGCPHMFEKMIALLKAKRIQLEPMISSIVPFNDVSIALDAMNTDKRRIKTLIQISEEIEG